MSGYVLQSLHLSSPVDMLAYSPGRSVKTIHILYRVREGRSTDEEMTETAQMVAKMRTYLPEYHTRAMKQHFKRRYNTLAGISPSVSEAIYQEMAVDTSVHSNPVVMERLHLILLVETGLVPDMITFNPGRPSTTYDVFFEKLDGVIEQLTAADERRHIKHSSSR